MEERKMKKVGKGWKATLKALQEEQKEVATHLVSGKQIQMYKIY